MALGWAVNIWRQIDPTGTPAHKRRGLVAEWETSLGGLAWLDALVTAGRAADLGGNGYPCCYTLTAAVLADALGAGVPRHDGPVTIGDDYVLAGGWVGELTLDRAVLGECAPDEALVVEAWDLS